MIKSVRVIVFILIALFGWNFPVTLHAAQGQSPTYVPDEVIVKYRDSVDEFKKEIGRVRVAGQRKRQFKLVRGLEVIKLGRNVSVAEAIDLLKQDPDVLYAEPNYRIFLTGNPNINLTPNDPSMGSLWGLTKINAPGAWNNSTGSANVAVGILDTGFDYTHGDLSANIFNNPAECVANGADNDGNGYEDDCHGIDVVNGDTDPIDDNGHGTHVAGTIGAVGNNGTGVVGVNWNVKMLSCKVFDANGSGSTDDAVLCLEYFEFMKVNRGVNIIATNNSWGGGDYSQALYDAIDAQREAGILFIAAAGNGNEFGIGQNNDSIPLYPCNYFVANMICVAATTSNDGKASFSNFGRRTVHVGAPGQNILSTVPGGYSSSNGTSMATPHVTGLAALLKAQDSNRDWRAIKNLILAGGNTVSSMANTITGRRINALGSMTCSNTAIQTRLQPIATTISASPGVPVVLASLNINCATPNGNVSVSVSSGGTVTLLDGGANGDQAAGDGIYSALWTPSATGTYTLTFPGNDRVTVNVANPTISVSPTSLSFGGVSVGQSSVKTFNVTNSGGGLLSGTATTSAPYSIASGGTYNLSGGQSQTVSVLFSPTSAATFLGAVTLTGAAGASVALSGNGIVPPTLSLSFDGRLRDRVGAGDAALVADGVMDGTMTVVVQPGSGNRTVTRLELLTSIGGIWNTFPDTHWILGAAASLDGTLYNSSTGSVNFAISDGSSFKLFAGDAGSGIYFPVGTTVTLTVNLSDGSTATASAVVPSPPPPPSPPTLSLIFDGRLRDRVGAGDAALGADGVMDGTMTVVVQPGSGNRTVTRLELRNSTGGIWNTTPDSSWILGAAPTLDGSLYNSSTGSVNFTIMDGSSFRLFAGDTGSGTYFPVGATLTLTVNLSDGSTATASTAPSNPPPPPNQPTLSMTYDGKLRDRVGQGETLSSDGAMDGTMTVVVQQGSGNRTLTKLELRLNTGGVWDTVFGGSWVLGVAGSLDGPLFNSSNSAVNFAVTDGTSFKVFAGDIAGDIYLPVGATATLTASFADGTTATASAVIPSPPPPPSPPTLSLSFDGKLRDRVGRGDAALGADGTMDGTLTVVVQPGSGFRTVTGLDLRPNTGGVWNAAPDGYWLLGAAPSLDGILYNSSNGSVNFSIADGSSFKLFAGDASSGTYFPTGATLMLTVNLSDGSTAMVNAVVP